VRGTGNKWKRVSPCPVNTVGVQDTTYGLISSPCRPCPPGLITDPLISDQGWTSMSACYNRAGWAWNGISAQPCANGTYTPARSMAMCQQCGARRFTRELAASKTDCLVEPGSGLLDSNTQIPMTSVAANQLTSAQAADNSVMECPASTYGPGGAVNSVCVSCPGGNVAPAPGATSIEECTCKRG
jgi:hypothetical protein